jgi:S1-C subfamily serine protease
MVISKEDFKVSNEKNALTALSEALSAAAAQGGAGTVMVAARRRIPASGVAYALDLILTADHVVEREEDIVVGLPNGDEISAQLAGRDPGSDLALLRLESSAEIQVEKAPDQAGVGQLALALGRPSGEGIQASLGVVSAIGGPIRTGRGGLLQRYLRTDAIPYPGFSGGPLVDVAGRLLGINTSGLARGASLVIPADLAWETAAALAEHGTVRRGYLGVRTQPVAVSVPQQEALERAQSAGLLVVSVEPGSPAERGGLIVGDILVGIADQAVHNHDQLLAALTGDAVGKETPVQVLRGGQPHTLTVTIGNR